MALKSGLGAQIGFGAETSYGGFTPPSHFYPFTSEGLVLNKEYVASQGIRAGRMMQAANLHRGTTRSVEGSVTIEFLNQGMGELLNLLHGNDVEPEAENGAFRQVHAIGESPPDGKSISCQVGRPDTGGTVRPFSYMGLKVISATLSLEAGGIASWTFNFDGRDEVTDEELAIATYVADAVPYIFTEGSVLINGDGIGNVRSVNVEFNQAQATDRYHLGNAGVKDEPIVNAFSEVTANATLEFASLADHLRFKAEELVELKLDLEPQVGSGSGAPEYGASVTLDAAKQVSSGPTVDGPDIITTDVSFMALDDGDHGSGSGQNAAATVIEYLSNDETVGADAGSGSGV